MIENWLNNTNLGMLFAVILLATGIAIVWRKQKGGWGPRNIQAFGLALVLPTIIVLAVTNSISKEVVATLLGGIIGYVLRGFDPDKGESNPGSAANGRKATVDKK